MEHYSARATHNSVYYNRQLLIWRRDQLGLKVVDISRLLSIREGSVGKVFLGTATTKHLYPVARFLGLDWAMVHDLDLRKPDYPKAVRNESYRGPHLIAPKEAVSNSP